MIMYIIFVQDLVVVDVNLLWHRILFLSLAREPLKVKLDLVIICLKYIHCLIV